MSKLQEIKDRIDDIMMHGKERRTAQLQLMYANGEIEWLIEQLEQAQATNQKLVECLEWYGDKNNYRPDDGGKSYYWGAPKPVIEDKGKRARQTLSEVKGNG